MTPEEKARALEALSALNTSDSSVRTGDMIKARVIGFDPKVEYANPDNVRTSRLKLFHTAPFGVSLRTMDTTITREEFEQYFHLATQ